MTETGTGTVGVAIVAVGAVTAQGPAAADLWEGALAGRVAIRPVQHLPMDGLSTKIAGEVESVPDPRRRYPRPDGFTERALDLALAAADEALAGPTAGLIDRDRFGVVLGTCNAGLLSGREWLRVDAEGGTPDPKLADLVTPQALAEAVAADFGLRGPVLAVNTACASGANAIGLAADLVRTGRADAMLAGGTDALSDVVLAGFNSLESLSPDPAAPYSGNRSGLSLGEGSGLVLLVGTGLAERLGLTCLAEVAGYGLSSDGYHATAPRPDGSGAANAIRGALRQGGVDPADVGYVNGHGTGTPKNDPAETKAIRLALGPAADDVLVSSTKSMVGHLLGAAGAVEGIVTAHAVARRLAPPTAGYLTADPECDLDYLPDGARPFDRPFALSNNFAFAGANAALLLARPGTPYTRPVRDADDVVITGVSALTPAGHGIDAAASAVLAGVPVGAAEHGLLLGRVDVDPEPYLSRKLRRRMDRLGVLSVISAADALRAAGIEPGSPQAAEVGVLFGTGTGPMEAMRKFVVPLLSDGPAAADPAVFPNTVYNQAAGQVALHLGLYGPTSTLSVGHATGAACVGYAADLIADRHVRAMVVTVTDTLTDEVVRAYDAQGALCGDAAFALAEGSVALVLESRASADARGATVLGTVLGHGNASDASRSRRWDARGRGMERAMTAALTDAGLAPARIEQVWLAAAGLTAADRPESLAVDRVFGPAGPVRHAPKRVLGEPMGVGPALCLALAVHGRGGPVLVNGSSLGGTHHCLVAGRNNG
ncbi:beta-ketoacyl-[acyl-carrier-protein] synthase family protein [Saccharothrix sp. NRRL B-16314]|uniref:beta-ketoacyl-[acyl-carrier-protein] synthase family protein n=1 Tax=Saccharothrix sp. NRRL B-16314 TaxID=1463825 RepID=UPI0005270CAB|nr:beta-ketoacyl-[acyl-carrier-protein] synthase family protein [Saccharothrix sp. NRRL B-16314]